MYLLLIKQFFRSKTVWLSFSILLFLGGLSIYIGKQYLDYNEVIITKSVAQQKKHIEIQTELHNDDLGLLLYYLKFSFVKPLSPLAGLSIGQSDINSQIQNVKILNLEGQKYDTDLVNPMQLQVGNLDFSFLIIFLFPLVIIALNFNLLSEEIEQGTWQLVTTYGQSSFKYILKKLLVRLAFVLSLLSVLFVIAKYSLAIPFSLSFINFILLSYLYIIFWFCVCLLVVTFKKSSNTNAIILLASWLVLVVFLPVVVNNYINTTYPVNEAFTMNIKQRDDYHNKWDTDKKETIEKFYKHYPQFAKYGIKEDGFSWLWYYAMQQMGDDESKDIRDKMYHQINSRELLSNQISQFFPPMQLQLQMNRLAETSLTDQIKFLEATSRFHENKRLSFYPKIFDSNKANSVDWNAQNVECYRSHSEYGLFSNVIFMLLTVVVLTLISVYNYFKLN